MPRTIEDAQIEAMIVSALETNPPDATHWSSRGRPVSCQSRQYSGHGGL
jgi:hypothetical protein